MAYRLAQTLKGLRQKLGFHSARSFYNDLASKSDLSFNYSYYMKIESGELNPSEKVIQQLAQLVPEADGDTIVSSYCHDLFPDRMPKLLKPEASTSNSGLSVPSPRLHRAVRSYRQELTPRQVAVIAQSQNHYFAFLIVTLARFGLSQDDMNGLPFQELGNCLKDLCSEKILFVEAGKYYPAHPEFSFPPSDTSLKAHYLTLDEYDLKKATFFNLKKLKSASFFRRISPKYLDLLALNFEVIFQLLRSADETDVNYNTEVISFELKVHSGKVSG